MSSAATDNLTAADPKPDAGLMISVSFLLIAVPFAYSHSVFDTGLMPKFLALMIGSIFVVLSWLRMEYRGEAFRVSLPTDLPIFLYLLIVALQWPRAYDVYQASLEVIKVFTFTAIYMAITRCSVPAHWRAWTSILVVVGTVVSAIGICQYLGVGFLWLPSAGFPSGTFGYRNTAAMFIITVLPFAILKFVQAKRPGPTFCWAVCGAALTLFLIYTRTRGAWVGAVASSVFALTIIIYRVGRDVFGSGSERLRWSDVLMKGGLVLSCLLLIAVAGRAAPSPVVVAALKQSSPLPPGKQGVGDAVLSVLVNTSEMSEGLLISGSGRTGMWLSTLGMIGDHPVVGVGLTNWEKVYPLYRLPDGSRNRFPRRPHNDYLWSWSELGILGFVTYLAVIAAAVVSVVSAVRRPAVALSGLGLAALSGFLALQTHACFSFPRERPGVVLAGTVCLALASAAFRTGHHSRPTRRTLSAALSATVLVIIGGSLVARAYVSESLTIEAAATKSAGEYDEAWRSLVTARKLGIFDYKHLTHLSEVALTTGHREATYHICKEVVSRHPNSVNGLLGLGRVSALLEEYDVSVDAYQRAISIRPDRYIFFKELGETFERLGRLEEALQTYVKAQTSGHRASWVSCKVAEVCFRLGKYDLAYANFEGALELQPDYARAIFGLGNVYLSRGMKDQAIDAYSRGLDLDADNAKAHYALAIIYISQGKRVAAVRHLKVALSNAEDEVMRREISSVLSKE